MGLILEARSPSFFTRSVLGSLQAAPHILNGDMHAEVLASCLVERARSNHVHMMIYQS